MSAETKNTTLLNELPIGLTDTTTQATEHKNTASNGVFNQSAGLLYAYELPLVVEVKEFAQTNTFDGFSKDWVLVKHGKSHDTQKAIQTRLAPESKAWNAAFGECLVLPTTKGDTMPEKKRGQRIQTTDVGAIQRDHETKFQKLCFMMDEPEFMEPIVFAALAHGVFCGATLTKSIVLATDLSEDALKKAAIQKEVLLMRRAVFDQLKQLATKRANGLKFSDIARATNARVSNTSWTDTTMRVTCPSGELVTMSCRIRPLKRRGRRNKWI